MFENKFNSKRVDPLVEAVKAAQADGEMRRQAIAAVNEEFGVYNRNAVVREHLAAYDAAIEEAYKSLKEGNKENKEKKKEHEEKTGLEHIKKMGGFPGQSLKRTARSLTKEELSDKQKKMAAIAGDKNKIGADDLAALRAGAKMEEKKGCYEEGTAEAETSMNVTSGGKPVTPAQTTSAPQNAPMPPKRPANLQELKKPTAKTAIKALDRAERSDDWYDSDYKRTNRLFAWKQKHLPGKSARNQKDTGKAELDDYDRKTVKKGGVLTKRSQKATKAEIKSRLGKHTKPKHLPEEALDEVSKRTAISAYREKEAQGRDTGKLHGLIKRKFGKETAKHAERAGAADTGNLFRRGESHGVDRLASAKSSSEMRKTKSGKIHGQDVASKKSEIKFRKSMSKFDKKGHLPEETIEEAKYSAKAARAGEDIGKPGKSFSMIAKKAGERYGSEEKGKKVAGAILAKIRAKHMKEDHE